MTIDLTGLRVLVTGGSRGIGRALALGLGQAGARVAVHCRNRIEEAREVASVCAPGSVALEADLGSVVDCARLFDETIAALGGLDVLVNNAAISLEMPLEMDDEAWETAFDRSIAVNLRSVEFLSRRAVRHFCGPSSAGDPGAGAGGGTGGGATIGGPSAAPRGGRLIHISSRAGFRGDTPDYMTYAATKAGMIALSRSIARGFGKQGVKSFVIAPGFVRTDMAQEFIDVYGENHVKFDLALDRLTEPTDIAPMVVLLASGLADHATGCAIDINAGSYVR